ncbi:MAG: FtsQ-type POTRA domain-containing protein [Actinomycetota bacterium]|nr:FtsQ-type POTRA domain-containing protein [Actinomycetota bacterium]
MKKKNSSLLKRRKRKIIKRRIWDFFKLLSIAVFLALAVWGLNFFYNSEYFKIKGIGIEDNTHYKDEEIVMLVDDIIGANIFEVDKKETEDIVTGELNWVKEAELSKIFPDKVIIILTERKPYLKIVCRDEYYLVDDEGVILERIDDNKIDSYGHLILVKNAVSYGVNIGEKVAKKNVLSCAEIYRVFDAELKNLVEEARIEDNFSGDIVFETVDGKDIIFGDSSYTVEKIEALKQLLKEETNCNIIDLRSPDNPVIE